MNSFLRWTPEVAQLLGPEALKTLSRTANGYVCARCDQPGRARQERTSIVVSVGDQSAPPVVNLAHGCCAQPQVIRIEGASIDINAMGDEELLSVTMLWPDGDTGVAGLIVDRHDAISVIHQPSGERDDPWLQLLLSLQWDLVLDVSQRFPVIDSCVVELDDGGRLVVTEPARSILLDPLPSPSVQWVHAARARGIVRVFAGDVGLSEGGAVHDALSAAIGAGRVVGAYVPVAQSATRCGGGR